MSKSKDCQVCKWNRECVNVNVFPDGDCLQYEKNIDVEDVDKNIKAADEAAKAAEICDEAVKEALGIT